MNDNSYSKQNLQLECWVLLVEDCNDSQRLISSILQRAGAKVFFADNGQIALNLVLESLDNGRAFDVILMDLQMPVLNGYEATKRLREADYTGPIIAITAFTGDHFQKKCIKAGCNDYLAKPVDPHRLIDLVAQYSTELSQLSSPIEQS